MSSSWRGSLAGEDLAMKTDGLEKKEKPSSWEGPAGCLLMVE